MDMTIKLQTIYWTSKLEMCITASPMSYEITGENVFRTKHGMLVHTYFVHITKPRTDWVTIQSIHINITSSSSYVKLALVTKKSCSVSEHHADQPTENDR